MVYSFFPEVTLIRIKISQHQMNTGLFAFIFTPSDPKIKKKYF